MARRVAKHDYAPLRMLVSGLGLRLGEAVGLQWGDVDKDASVLHVRRQWLATGEYCPPQGHLAH